MGPYLLTCLLVAGWLPAVTAQMLEGAASWETAKPPLHYLGSWAYTVPSASGLMWTADDFVAGNPEKPWQNIILAAGGNNTAFAELIQEVYRRTGVVLPALWPWEGWLTSDGNSTEMQASWQMFLHEYQGLRRRFQVLPPLPFGVFLGDEPQLLNLTRQRWLSAGLQLVKQNVPSCMTYLNLLFASLACPDAEYCCCNNRTADAGNGNATQLARALGDMQLDWLSSDEYYDVTTKHYRETYISKLYPHLRPDQRVFLVPFAAYCEIGCPQNLRIAPEPADSRCLSSARAHHEWLLSDDRVAGMFVYRLKNLWQNAGTKDPCVNPAGTGLGLVDRCANGTRAMPQTFAYYANNISRTLVERQLARARPEP